MNCCKMFQLLLPSLIARLLNNSLPSSLELSRNRWIQVAPIKDTCCCHAVNQWPSMPSWLTVKMSPCKHGTYEGRGRVREYPQSKQAWVENPVKPNMEPSALHAGQGVQTDPFQSHPAMTTFLHMPFASTQACSHPDSKEHYMQRKFKLSLQASLKWSPAILESLSPQEKLWHPVKQDLETQR